MNRNRVVSLSGQLLLSSSSTSKPAKLSSELASCKDWATIGAASSSSTTTLAAKRLTFHKRQHTSKQGGGTVTSRHILEGARSLPGSHLSAALSAVSPA